MSRSTVVLGVVAATMLAFILFFERGTITTGEKATREGRILQRFIKDRITRLQIQRKGVTTVLVREPDEEGDLALGTWKLRAPIEADADEEAVSILLGELEWMDSRRRLEDLTPKDVAPFGFDKPRYRVRFFAGDQEVVMLVGNQSPKGDGVYVQVADRPEVAFVVGKDLIEALDHEPGHFHTKDLHDGINVYSSTQLTLRDAAGERVVSRKGSDWFLQKPVQERASRPDLDEVFQALDRLKATRYIAAAPEARSKYGLEPAKLAATVQRKAFDEKAKKNTDKLFSMHFRIGAACAGHAGESYLQLDDGPVMCALDADLDKVARDLKQLREGRLVPLESHQIAGVDLKVDGTQLVLTENEADSSWTFAFSKSGKKVNGGPADTDAVEAWFKDLATIQATDHTPETQVTNAPGKLHNPKYVLALKRRADRPTYVVKVGQPRDPDLYATRSGEAGTVRVPMTLLPLLQPISARFRPLTLFEKKQSDLQRVSIKLTTGPEVVVRDAGTWKVHAPIQQAADALVMAELARRFAPLRVSRFVADEPSAMHGMAKPFAEVELDFTTSTEQTERHRLILGAEVPDGRFAQLAGDPAVFVAPSGLVQLLLRPHVSADLLRTPIEELEHIRVRGSEHDISIEHRDGSFVASGDNSEGGHKRATHIAELIATLRPTSSAHYGVTDTQADVSIEITAGGATHTLKLGPPVTEGTRTTRTLVRSDLDVTYLIGSQWLATLLGNAP